MKKKFLYAFLPFFLLNQKCKTSSQEKKNVNNTFEIATPPASDQRYALFLSSEDVNSNNGFVMADAGIVVGAPAFIFMAMESAKARTADRPNFQNFQSGITQDELSQFNQNTPEEQENLLRQARDLLKDRLGKNTDGSVKKLKVLVVGAAGGDGHKKAFEGMRGALGQDLFTYEYVEVPLPTKQWNEAMQKGKGKSLAKMVSWKETVEKMFDTPIGRIILNKKLEKAFSGEAPDIVIQANHNLTRGVMDYAKSRGAQFRLIPTDEEISHFIFRAYASGENDASFRYDLGNLSEKSKKTLEDARIRSQLDVGWHVRPGFANFADRMYFRGEENQLQEEMDKFLAGENVFIDNKEYNIKNLETLPKNKIFTKFDRNASDDAFFVMLGGKANGVEIFTEKLKLIANNAQKIRGGKEKGKLHIYFAQGDAFAKELHDTLDSLAPEVKDKVVIHTLKSLDDAIIPRMFYYATSYIKAGGTTVKEAFTTGIRGVCDLFEGSISKEVIWERENAEKLAERGFVWLNKNNSEEEIIDNLSKAFKATRVKPSPNNFYRAYPYAVIQDWIKFFDQRPLPKIVPSIGTDIKSVPKVNTPEVEVPKIKAKSEVKFKK